MGRSCIIRIPILCLLLFVLFDNGFGRQLVGMFVREDHSIAAATELQIKSREMIELDYVDAGPNNNGRSVYPLPDLPQRSSLPPPPPPPLPPPPPGSGY